jgi:DNA helicase-2/ATP-dependent DNA helicase PcrA
MNARRPSGSPRAALRLIEGRVAAPVDLEVVRPLLKGLDRDQRRAVTHRGGPLLVIAGPGTGKTEVITRRIAWLIATKRARPREILALTFTDKAAAEMQARVDLLVPYGQADSAILTFHAFGDQVLREHGHELGLPGAPRVIGRAEQVVLLREHLFELGLDRYRPLGDPARMLATLADLFTRAKDEGIAPEDLMGYARDLDAGSRAAVEGIAEDERGIIDALLDEASGVAELATAYERYQGLLRDRGLIDFGDQVALATRLLRERPAVAAAVGARFRYVLVDEAQDMDPSQMALLRQVAAHRELTLVGDDDQAIYAFRGAAVEHLLELSDEPHMRHIVLRTSHRSHAPILETAHRLIRHNDPYRLEARHGLDKGLRARRRSRRAAPVRQLAFATAPDEAREIAARIARRIRSGERPRDIAVLVRTNGDTGPLVTALGLEGVAVRTGAGVRWSDAPEVREILAFLRVVDDPERSTDLYAVASGAPYGLGGLDLTSILGMASRRHRSLWSVLGELDDQPGILRLSESTRAAIRRLLRDVAAGAEAAHVQPAGRLLYDHLRRSGRYAALVRAAQQGDDAPLRRVARLFDAVSTRSILVADPRLAGLLPHLDGLLDAEEEADGDADPSPLDAVSVLTVHKAKGLEFRVVYVAGLVDGRFPMRARPERVALPQALRRQDASEEVAWAEERRLAYVAFTRARDELILSYAVRQTPGGRMRRPSPFLAEALDHEPVAPDEPTGIETATSMLMPPDGTPRPARPVGPEDEPAGPLSLSHSQVDDYLACPLKYRLRHLVRVPTPPHHALVVGNALHQAVAAWHLGHLRSRPLGEEGVLDAFAAHWSSEGFVSRDHEEARFAAGRGALQRFLATPPDATRRTIGVERPFQVRLGADVVRGRYDRVDEGSDGVVITDYKSSDVREQRRADERARDSLQLQLYALAWEAETGTLPSSLELWFLDSGVVGRATPDGRRLDRARATLAAVAQGIRSGDFRARPDQATCSYCPYRRICPSAAR